MLAWFVQYQIAIIMGRSQHFPVPVLSSFLFPSPSLLRSGPLIHSYLGSYVSSAGAEPRTTTHYVLCTRKTSYRSRVSNTSRVFNWSQGQGASIRSFTVKLCYRKDDRAMRPIYGCPKNLRDSLICPRLLFPIFHGGGVATSQKIGSVPGYAHAVYPPTKKSYAYRTD